VKTKHAPRSAQAGWFGPKAYFLFAIGSAKWAAPRDATGATARALLSHGKSIINKPWPDRMLLGTLSRRQRLAPFA